MKQTITKAQLAKLLVGDVWTYVKYASWLEFKPLPLTVPQRFQVVYWAAWHWGDLIWLVEDLRRGEREIYISQDPASPHAVQIDPETKMPFPGQQGGEFSPSPRVDGQPTRHADVSRFLLGTRLANFPNG